MTNDTFLSAVKTMCKNCIHAPVCAHVEDTEGYAERLDACSAVKPVPVLLSLEVKCKHFQEARLQSGSFPLWPEGVRSCDTNCVSSTPDPNIRAYSKYDGAHSAPYDSTLDRIRRGEGPEPLGGDTSGIYIEGPKKKSRKR